MGLGSHFFPLQLCKQSLVIDVLCVSKVSVVVVDELKGEKGVGLI